jgi:hypothetical protein
MSIARTSATFVLSIAGSFSTLLGVNSVLAQDNAGKPPAAKEQTIEPPLSDTRLTVHTLLREDFFSGYLEGDMKRLARGEKNADALMEARPAQKANLLAWKASLALFRAAQANENHNGQECKKKYQEAVDMFSEAAKLKTGNDGVNAITGGSYTLLLNRLPQEYRAAGWNRAYECYQAMWKQQSSIVQGLPVHFKGELLAGLVLTSIRTGHDKEAAEFIDKMTTMLHDTPYEAAAKKLKADPKSAAIDSISCVSCHDAGRLAPKLAALDKK